MEFIDEDGSHPVLRILTCVITFADDGD
jgi:hypothetical protein